MNGQFEMKAGYELWTREIKNVKKFIDYILDAEGVPVAKRCGKCNVIKPLEDYNKKSENKFDGKRSDCKACHNADNKKWYKENAEHKAEYSKQYRQENKEQIAEYMRQYHEANKEQHAEYKRQWQRNNPDKMKTYRQRRRAKKRNLPNTLTGEQMTLMLQQQNNKCVISGKSDNLELEHFIPISWGVGGTTYENCYYLTKSLNRSKGNKNPFEWIQTQSEEYQKQFYNVLVPLMASKNGMTTKDYEEYIYHCEAMYLNSKEEAEEAEKSYIEQ